MVTVTLESSVPEPDLKLVSGTGERGYQSIPIWPLGGESLRLPVLEIGRIQMDGVIHVL